MQSNTIRLINPKLSARDLHPRNASRFHYSHNPVGNRVAATTRPFDTGIVGARLTCTPIGRFGTNMTLSQLIRRLITKDPSFRDLLDDYDTLLAELAETPDDAGGTSACKRRELLELRSALEDEILKNLQRVLPEKVDDGAE